MHNQTDPFHVDYQITEIQTMVSPLFAQNVPCNLLCGGQLKQLCISNA